MPRRSSASSAKSSARATTSPRRSPIAPMAPTPKQLIRAFRNDYNPRIAVTVDMIATGTDVKPLEVLIFLRDVKSELYFEQMKGRGARTIIRRKAARGNAGCRGQDPLRADRRGRRIRKPENRLAAAGARPRHLLRQAHRRDRAGTARRDAFATLAARLAALDRRIGEKDRAAIVKAAGGVDLSGLAARLLDAIDPDALAKRVPKDAPEPEQKKAREAAKEEAATLFDDPDAAAAAEGRQGRRGYPHRHDLDRCRRFVRLGRDERPPTRSSDSSASWRSAATNSSRCKSSIGCPTRSAG